MLLESSSRSVSSSHSALHLNFFDADIYNVYETQLSMIDLGEVLLYVLLTLTVRTKIPYP